MKSRGCRSLSQLHLGEGEEHPEGFSHPLQADTKTKQHLTLTFTPKGQFRITDQPLKGFEVLKEAGVTSKRATGHQDNFNWSCDQSNDRFF